MTGFDNYKVVVKNDDNTSFATVITSLVTICQHNMLQAEQCATIIHYNGSCSVKERVSRDNAKQYGKLLKEAGLNVAVTEM